MTGASVPDEGLLLSTEKLEGIEDIVDIGGQPHVVVKPGTVVSQLQAELAKKNLFYPIGPTSKDQCRIGANIATNATGEDSYKYGTVRQYVQSLELITPDCKSVFYSREPGEAASGKRNTAGYFTGWENPIDLIIGSEGTLGFISRATIRLIPGVPSFSALIPFESNMEALSFAVNLTLNEKDKKPRTLELIDSGALKMMKTSRSFPSIPNEIAAYLYIKQEYDSEKNWDDGHRYGRKEFKRHADAISKNTAWWRSHKTIRKFLGSGGIGYRRPQTNSEDFIGKMVAAKSEATGGYLSTS